MEHELYKEHSQILTDVLNERDRQNDLWGDDRMNHHFLWISILSKTLGKTSMAAMDVEFGLSYGGNEHYKAVYRKELVQLAAVAIAAIHDLDTNGIYVAGGVDMDGDKITISE